MYVYIESEKGLWTVGFYDPTGKWQPESDHHKREDAAIRVSFLNGGTGEAGSLQRVANLERQIGELTTAADGLVGLIRAVQTRCSTHLHPDSSGDDKECLSDVLYLLDGPEQRAIEDAYRNARTGGRNV